MHYVFFKEGLGWRFVSSKPLPQAPWGQVSQATENPGGETEPSGRDPRSIAEKDTDSLFSAIGYQVDEKGSLYWICREALFRHSEAGWQRLWTFPKEIRERRGQPGLPEVSAHFAILPGGRIAVIGAQDAFLKILEWPEIQVAETGQAANREPSSAPKPTKSQGDAGPRLVRAHTYDAIDACAETMQGLHNVQYCFAGDHLYFYLGDTGRFFRLNGDSWTLTELETPWIAKLGGPSPASPRRWRPSQSSTPPSPVLPEAIAFSPNLDGSVHVRALMWNMDPAVIYSFDLGSEGSTIKAQIHMESELPEPIVLPDSMGNLVALKALVKQSNRRQQERSIKDPETLRAQPIAPDKPNSK
jgi:hypothetical protein